MHPGSHLITDERANYPFIAAKNQYVHEIINHIEGYVRDHVHTNGMENFWSCLKCGLNGTYFSVEPYHLDRYVDEQVFRFNLRKDHTDATRFKAVLKDVGRRLTYAELTGRFGPSSLNTLIGGGGGLNRLSLVRSMHILQPLSVKLRIGDFWDEHGAERNPPIPRGYLKTANYAGGFLHAQDDTERLAFDIDAQGFWL